MFWTSLIFFVFFFGRVGTIATNLDEEKGEHRADDVSYHLFSLQYPVVFQTFISVTEHAMEHFSYVCETAQCMANYTVDCRMF